MPQKIGFHMNSIEFACKAARYIAQHSMFQTFSIGNPHDQGTADTSNSTSLARISSCWPCHLVFEAGRYAPQ